MRDLLLYLLLAGSALYALRAPWVGIMAWTAIGLGSPHIEFGWTTYDKPFAMVVAITTLIGFVLNRDRQTILVHPILGVLFAFVIWTCITLPFSIHFSPSYDLWLRSIKIFLMLFVTVALLTTERRLQIFIWVCVIAIGFYGIKGGVFTLVTGGKWRVWGPPDSFIAGNNEIGLALIMIIPLLRYLQQQMRNRWAILFMWGWMALCAVAAVGTYSRGALLAITAMSITLWWKGNQKILFGAILAVAVLAALPLMPEHWWDRMETIRDYQQDDSALGRINAWWNAWNLANDRFFGGGFMVSRADVFLQYSPDPLRVHAAHSIYFQVLGEHGWVGFVLYMTVFVWTYFLAASITRMVERHRADVPDLQWAVDLAKMLQVSFVGFAVGGAFLSLAYWDMPYNMVVMMTLTHWFVKRRVEVLHRAEKPTVIPGTVAA